MPRLRHLLAVLAFGVSPLLAQEHAHAPLEQLGRVAFPTSCRGDLAPRFERAMALLHSFWWEEAKTAFAEQATADSTCAMAQWGLALAYWNNPFAGGPEGEDLAAGARAAERASAIGAPTERERDYIAAVAALYRDYSATSNARRLESYSEVMAEAYRKRPDDPELAIYYALSLVATAARTDTTYARQKLANDILNPLFHEQPDHPGLAHYIIHANDSPALARYGLDAARRYAEIAPSVPHAQHMPSHIFIRLGMWDENVAANRRSYQAGLAYAAQHFPGAYGSHEFHAMDYMVYGNLQRGRDSAARAVAHEALGVTDVRPAGTILSEYAVAAMPARLALERDAWGESATLAVTTTHLVGRTVTHFARGMGLARSGNAAGALAEAAALERVATQLRDAGQAYWARIAEIKRRVVGSWAALAVGDTATALREARDAADVEDVTDKHPVTPGEVLPARELYADMLLATGRYGEALGAYETTLAREPGRARSLLGAARAASAMANTDAAARWARQYLELMADGDGARPELSLARRLAGP